MYISSDIGINDLKKLIQVIQDKFEFDFSNYTPSSFKRRVLRFIDVKRIGSVENLVNKINSGEIKKGEFLAEISTNVTELLRDSSFWKRFKKILSEQSFGPRVRIWQYGCASGEELYSLIILLEELNLLSKSEILSTDISQSIIDRAKQGLVPSKSMELNTSNFIKTGFKGEIGTYFKEEGEYFRFNRELLNKVTFKEMNPIKDSFTPNVDIIMCRNVLIYFNLQLQNEMLKRFHQSLQVPGFLVLGSRESLEWSDVSVKFTTMCPEERIFRKNKM